MSKKVDICVCVKDRQNVVKKTIDCILNQTFKDFRLLLCDGKSDDLTVSTLLDYQNKNDNVVCWQSEEKGYVNSHNFILSKTDAEYICFIDSDDLVDEKKLAEQVKYLDEHPDVDVVSSSVILPNKKILPNTFVELNNEQITEALKKGIPMAAICHFESCMFRRKCLEKFTKEKYFFDEYETGRCGEGFLYALHFFGYKFANIISTLYIYTKGVVKDSMTNTIIPEMANLMDAQTYDMKRTAIMEMFDNYNQTK